MRNKVIKYDSLVVYHNDFNSTINLSNLTVLESNILFSLIKDFKYDDDQVLFFWAFSELKDFVKSTNATNEKIVSLIESLKSKIGNKLFVYMEFEYYEDNKDKIKGLEVELNLESIRLFKGLKSHFTTFDLEEYKELKSTYSKAIFRLLSQFSVIGKLKIDYHRFRELLGIPTSYNYAIFNSHILKPSVKELSSKFKGLSIELIKDREDGVLNYKFLVFKFQTFKKVKRLAQYNRNNQEILAVNKLLKYLSNSDDDDFFNRENIITALSELRLTLDTKDTQ